MQPHIADGGRMMAASTSNTSTTTANRRESERGWNAEFVVTRYVVVLNLGPVCRAELINESEGGIAIQVRDLSRTADAGRLIEVIYRGKRRAAEIRHIAANDSGFLVGLRWMKAHL
ncbi:MAG: hypothetical protein H6822_17430 [Planctomycetaceae bacterium]|nr:hypothetical protein [Planctomycetales bacterium]MCB9923968.1 hypothetical protein [Planctomycetaceae bacterium]